MSGPSRSRGLLVTATIAYSLVIAWITLDPAPPDPAGSPFVTWMIATLRAFPPTSFLTYDLVEFLANIAMFVPFGLLVAWLMRVDRWWLAVVIGFAASCAIELTQLLWLPARVADVGDVVANTTGALIGAVIALLVRRARALRLAGAGRVEA